MRRPAVIAFVLAGIVAGSLSANFKPPDYAHKMIILKEGGRPGAIYIKGSGPHNGAAAPVRPPASTTLLITVMNQLTEGDVRMEVAGGRVYSTFPPIVAMPFRKWVGFKDGVFSGLTPGARVNAVVVLDNREDCWPSEASDGDGGCRITFTSPTDDRIIMSIPIAVGEDHEKHRH